MKKSLLVGLLAVSAILLTMSLSAQENAKIKLPDGLYLYSFEIRLLKDGSTSIKSPSFFLVQNNVIYSELDALKKIGAETLNNLFTEKKYFKLLSAGEKIGKLHQMRVKEDGQVSFEAELFVKNINDNPMYGEHSGLGSVAKYVAVPEEYKEVKIKKNNTISQEEAEKIKKLIKEKLFHLVKQRKEYTQSYSKETLKYYSKDNPPLNYKDAAVNFEELQFLDKVSQKNEEMFLGLYCYHFKNAPVLQVVFSVKKDVLTILTTDHDDETLEGSEMTVRGMLDVDGCGKAELLVIKRFGGTAGGPTHMEIYKHKADGSWARIQKIKYDHWEWVAYERSRYDAKNAELAKKYAKNIKLPDGLYMYDSRITQLKDGREDVRFQKFFVVQNNIIYSSQEAMKKFGASELNKLFAEKKKLKILLSGEKIGEILNLEFYNRRGPLLPIHYKEELLTKNIKEGPAYGRGSGSAVKCLAVPEEYKEVKKKVYTTIPQEEVDKITGLAKEKLLPLIINRKEIRQYKIKSTELGRENLEIIDKISYRNSELYIGTYGYGFATPENTYSYGIVFSAKDDDFRVITTNHDDETADYDGDISLYGMLDVDSCGEEELILEKVSGGLDEARMNISIYKRKADGDWERIQKIAWRIEL